MNDEQLKREIEEALAAEPSPQFIARVRQHIAVQPRPARWSSWAALVTGLAAAAVVAGIVLLQPRESTTPSKPAEVAKAPAPQEESPSVQSARPTLQRKQPAKVVAKPRPSELQVLINPREAAAFRSFLEDVEEQKIDPARLDSAFDAIERAKAAAIEPMPMADLKPIEVQPLSSAAPEEKRGNL